jgi:hypothetical protein
MDIGRQLAMSFSFVICPILREIEIRLYRKDRNQPYVKA